MPEHAHTYPNGVCDCGKVNPVGPCFKPGCFIHHASDAPCPTETPFQRQEREKREAALA